jgi:hypothetical protein
MRILFCVLICCAGLSYLATAQTVGTPPLKRVVRFKFITKDSVNIPLNDEFEMIEDSCARITRYGHLKMPGRKFFGHFKDVSRTNPDLVLTEGNYTADGLKDGSFTTRYLNGQLQAQGNFKNNDFDGPWAMYYDDGKPKLTFEATDKNIVILNVWDAKGVKFVDNGKGNYRVDMGSIYWKGKLLNGKPDGNWHAYKTDDATNTELITENYKNGAFVKGKGPLGDYADAPRLMLIGPDNLPFVKVELLRVSSVPCNGVKRKHLVHAQYSQGLQIFSENIKDLVSPFLGTVNLKAYENTLTLKGEISVYGDIIKLQSEGDIFNESIARGLISQLRKLPPLNPATADGKPVPEKFTITFKFTQGFYSFSYRFLPLEVN